MMKSSRVERDEFSVDFALMLQKYVYYIKGRKFWQTLIINIHNSLHNHYSSWHGILLEI